LPSETETEIVITKVEQVSSSMQNLPVAFCFEATEEDRRVEHIPRLA